MTRWYGRLVLFKHKCDTAIQLGQNQRFLVYDARGLKDCCPSLPMSTPPLPSSGYCGGSGSPLLTWPTYVMRAKSHGGLQSLLLTQASLPGDRLPPSATMRVPRQSRHAFVTILFCGNRLGWGNHHHNLGSSRKDLG